MKLLLSTAYDFIVCKDYKNRSKTYPFSMSNQLRIQHLTCSLVNHIFLKSLPCEFSHRIFHKLLIIHLLVNYLLLSKFILACHLDGGIWTKNNLLIHCDGVFDSLFKLCFCFHTVSTGYIQHFCKFQQRRLFHLFIVFVTQGRLHKNLFMPSSFLILNKSITIITQHVVFCFSRPKYLHSSIYTCGWNFLPCW